MDAQRSRLSVSVNSFLDMDGRTQFLNFVYMFTHTLHTYTFLNISSRNCSTYIHM